MKNNNNLKCKICKSPVKDVISFGQMPIANGFVNNIKQDKFRYHLNVVFCPKCYMVQLGETVEPQKMFNENYHFLSSTSHVMEDHFKNVAQEIIAKVKSKKDPFVVEIGSNDGIMLKHIAAEKIKHLGVEPSRNVAEMSKKFGVEVISEFFNQATARKIVKKYGKADAIFGANTICHIEDINAVFEGIEILLKDDGVFFFEEPYIYDIVKKSSFDQIYDEHVYFYSGLSVSNLCKRNKLQLVDMKHQVTHGGSMRYYIKKGHQNKLSKRMQAFIDKEKALELHKLKGYLRFKDNVNKVCNDLKKLLVKINSDGNRIVGYGATSKSTTLLTYAQIGPELIECIYDTTPTKINKYTPGTHIPVKEYNGLTEENLKYVLLLAWNHKKEIFAKEKQYRETGGKFITFFPKVRVE